MANFKRKKTRRNVRCTLCTPYRWMGNSRGRFAGSAKRGRDIDIEDYYIELEQNESGQPEQPSINDYVGLPYRWHEPSWSEYRFASHWFDWDEYLFELRGS